MKTNKKIFQSKDIPDVFNRIYHLPREAMNLSMEEYCILDTVFELSKLKHFHYPEGWCYAGKGYFAKILDMNRVSVHRIIKKLLKRGLLIKGNAIDNKVVPLCVDGMWKSKDLFDPINTCNSFNNVYHRPRILLRLSCAEFCILDTMYQLGLNVEYDWHRSSKRWIAEKTKIPYPTLCRLFDKLVRRGFIKNEERPWLVESDHYYVCDTFVAVVDKENRAKNIVSTIENGVQNLSIPQPVSRQTSKMQQ